MADFARSTHPAVQSQLDRLSKLSPGGDQLGLDRISRVLERLGRPQDQLPPIFHVAGTNGKGSTCAFLRAAIEGAGLQCHVFTSPHLVRFNERIRISGKLINDALLAELLAEVLDSSGGIEPSFFEVTTAVAFLAFARIPADACILEVGLGGRLDATNVIDRSLVCGIAALGVDHEQFLGSELAGIATEKAGISRLGVPLVSLAQHPEAEAAIESACEETGAPLLLEGRDWQLDSRLRPGLPGYHQVRNANLAWQMLAAQKHVTVSSAAFRRAIAKTRWPGRFQRIGPATWVDGAHNPAAASALAETLAQTGPMHIILGILANKNADEIVRLLRPYALSLTFVPVADHPHHDPETLAERFGGTVSVSLAEALTTISQPRLIAGSLYLVGAALAQVGEELD